MFGFYFALLSANNLVCVMQSISILFWYFHLYIVTVLFPFFRAEDEYVGEDISWSISSNYLLFRRIIPTVVFLFAESLSVSFTDTRKLSVVAMNPAIKCYCGNLRTTLSLICKSFGRSSFLTKEG